MFPTKKEYSHSEKIKLAIKDPAFAAQYFWYKSKPDKSVSLTLSSRLNSGTNIFDFEWDLLIVLDSCRFDALKSVAVNKEYDFLNPEEIDRIKSVGSATPEWTAATFTEDYRDRIENTALISANGWPLKILKDGYRPEDAGGAAFATTSWNTISETDLGAHECAWKHGGRLGEDDRTQANGSVVTDLAISVGRKNDFDKVVAHFIEPHYPYAGAARQRGDEALNDIEMFPFEQQLVHNKREEVWNTYLTELRVGLSHVKRLLENFDAETVLITADHGECFGEWGMYGHTRGSFIPQLRTVPLTETTAEDTGSYSPTIGLETEIESEETNVEDNLRALGYLT